MSILKNKGAVLLLVLGLAQMTGDLTGIGPLKGVGAATAASPAPKVFSAVEGYETYSTRFILEWTDTEGSSQELVLTPEVYSGLEGPYNRRNVYGAALAYGPVLSTREQTREMFWSVARYGLTGKAPVLRELGIDPATVDGPVRVRYVPLPGTEMGLLPAVLEVSAP